MTPNPRGPATSSTPRAMVVKNGFVMSDSTSAMVFVRFERRCRATALGTYPRSAIARSTRVRVSWLV